MLNTNPCVDDDLCCNTIFAYGEYLRCQAMDALDRCFVGGSCRAQIRSYLSMGAGDDGIADSLIVVAGPMTPTANTTVVGPSIYQMSFDIRLRESGYPMVQAAAGGRGISLPDPDAQSRATAQVWAHGAAILARMNTLKMQQRLAPEGYRCTRGMVTNSEPLPVQGGVAGWTTTVTLNIPWA